MNILDLYQKRFGIRVIQSFRHLDEETAERFVASWQKLLDDGEIDLNDRRTINEIPLCELFPTPCPVEVALEDMHRSMLGAVKTMWFKAISREDAIAILNALHRNLVMSSITIFAEDDLLSFSDTTFREEWNRANKSQAPIEINPDYLFNN